jgi:hypothetical protein
MTVKERQSNGATKPSSLSMDEAISRLSKGRGSTAAAEPQGDAKRAGPTPEPTAEDVLDPDVTNPNGESDAGGSDGEAAHEPADEGADETIDYSKDPLVAMTVDGEEIEVPLSELIASYSKGADYTNKTKALAEQRRAVDQKAKDLDAQLAETTAERAQLQQTRQSYAASLDHLQSTFDQADSEWAKVDWDALEEEDPIKAASLYRKHQQHLENKRAVEAERQRVAEESAQEARRQHAESVKTLRTKIQEALPEWSDEKIRTTDWAGMQKTAHKLGFTDVEINGTTDPRVFLMLHKAWKFDRAEATRKSATSPAPNRVPGREGGKAATAPAPVVQPQGARPVIRAGNQGSGVSFRDALEKFQQVTRKGGGNPLDAGAALLRAHRDQLTKSARR